MRLFAPRRAPQAAACGRCRSFVDDLRALEAALPGLASLSSAYASVRGDDGLCAVHDRFVSARSGCASFVLRPAAGADGRQP